jgi:GTPase SAR1 family protein
MEGGAVLVEITRGPIKTAQKVVLYGPEGIGKSTLASQFPDPLFIDTEGSTKHLDVARLPFPTSWTILLNEVDYVKANPTVCQTLVIDTADWAEQLCMDAICATYKKTGIEEFGYGKGYVYLAEEFGRLLNSLNDLIERGINVVFTAHAQMRKFEQPDEAGAYDRWELKLQKKTAPLLKEWTDMLLFCTYKTYVVDVEGTKKAQGGKRTIYTTHHPCWDAKNRYNLPPEIEMDYKAFAHCIPTRNDLLGQPGQAAAQDSASEAPYKDLDISRIPTDIPPKDLPKSELQSSAPAIDPDIPKPLADLMAANGVTAEEIQQAVASRGYYPVDTPITNYDPQFVAGCLVGAWPQVFQTIQGLRES